MLAQPYPVSLATRFTVPGNYQIPQGYYRSKLFINASTTNPLVAAAAPLLSLLERLCVSPTLPPINSIRDNIEHELYAFHCRLIGQQYAEEFIIIACYLMKATIDELLGKNFMRLYGHPPAFKAFTPSSHDDIGPERRFFEIVHHIKERIHQYLDLLELAYYCLIAGFEGEQHLRPDGRQNLDNLTEELYLIIKENRANKPPRLFKGQKSSLQETKKNHKPILTTFLLAFGTLISCYLGTHTLLESKAKTLMNGHTILASMDR